MDRSLRHGTSSDANFDEVSSSERCAGDIDAFGSGRRSILCAPQAIRSIPAGCGHAMRVRDFLAGNPPALAIARCDTGKGGTLNFCGKFTQ